MLAALGLLFRSRGFAGGRRLDRFSVADLYRPLPDFVALLRKQASNNEDAGAERREENATTHHCRAAYQSSGALQPAKVRGSVQLSRLDYGRRALFRVDRALHPPDNRINLSA